MYIDSAQGIGKNKCRYSFNAVLENTPGIVVMGLTMQWCRAPPGQSSVAGRPGTWESCQQRQPSRCGDKCDSGDWWHAPHAAASTQLLHHRCGPPAQVLLELRCRPGDKPLGDLKCCRVMANRPWIHCKEDQMAGLARSSMEGNEAILDIYFSEPAHAMFPVCSV